MSALLEHMLVIAAVGAAAAYLAARVFKRRKKSGQCSGCPTAQQHPRVPRARSPERIEKEHE